MFRHARILLILGFSWGAILLCIVPASYAATEVYFVRHAETMGNLTHHHSHENDRTLSPKGQHQVELLTRKLALIGFDTIVVSPKYRALKTILPYLKKNHLKAEIWPELAECCWQKKSTSFADKPGRGSPIKLDSAIKPYFFFANKHDRFNYNTHGYGQGMMQTFMAAEKLKRRLSGSDKRILLVGHYHAGSRLIEILQGLEPTGRYKISNTQLLRLRENRDNSFSLLNH